jgi:hypothetical protein
MVSFFSAFGANQRDLIHVPNEVVAADLSILKGTTASGGISPRGVLVATSAPLQNGHAPAIWADSVVAPHDWHSKCCFSISATGRGEVASHEL